MRWTDRLRMRLRTLLWPGRVERELDEEMAFHVESQIDAHRRSGLSAGEARRAAYLDLGSRLAAREGCRETWGRGQLDAILRDLRLALRNLRRSPGLVVTCVLSLALGIGANTAMFSLVDAVLLRPLPLPDPGRLVAVKELRHGEPTTGNPRRLYDWQAETAGILAIAGTYSEDLVLSGESEPVHVAALRTVGDLGGVLGIQPALGRAFSPAERNGLGAPVVLLGEGFWRRQFGARASVLGRAVVLGRTAFTVIGVLPAAAGFPYACDAWAPAPSSVQLSSRKAAFLALVARLAPGYVPAQVDAQLRTVAARLAHQYPDSDAGLSAHVEPLAGDLVQRGRTPLLVLCGVVVLVLMIACVNVATLLVARARGRRQEAAIRIALGGGRDSLMRLFVSESIVLALVGGAAGMLAAPAGIALLRAFLPAEVPRLAAAQVDWRVGAFALGLSLATGLLAGLAPAWRAFPAGASESLKEGAPATSGASRDWLPRAFVVGEVTLALILLVGAVLLARTFVALRGAALGFRPSGVLAFAVDLPWDTSPETLHAAQREMLSRFAAIPGVRAAGLIDRLPLLGGAQGTRMVVRNRPAPPERELEEISQRATSPGYFAALDIPFRAGHTLAPYRPNAPRTTVINETLARQRFGMADPLGSFVAFDPPAAGGAKQAVWYEIVGVVGDVRQSPAAPVLAEAYVLAEHTFWPLTHFVLRTAGSPLTVAAAARARLRQLDANLVIDDLGPLDEKIAATATEPRLRMWVLTAFALLGLLLASVGVYGVLAQDIAGRVQEIGVRMALGARPAAMLWLAMRRGLLLASGGLVAGTAAALGLSRLLASLLFGVKATDAGTFAGAALFMLAVALAASYVPARRAARVDPMNALRRE